MVSRSIEKMLIIAIGFTIVVLVGVPVLQYSISSSQLEMAQNFANAVHNATERVDKGFANNTLIEIVVPQFVTISAAGNILTITYEKEGVDNFTWSNTYNRPVKVIAPPDAGLFIMLVSLVEGEVQLEFSIATL